MLDNIYMLTERTSNYDWSALSSHLISDVKIEISCLSITFFGMVYDNSISSIKEHPYIESNSQCTDVSSLFIVFLVKQFLRISLFSNSDSTLQFF